MQDCFDIRKIHIHITVYGNDFRNSLGRRRQDIVSLGKSFLKHQISKQFPHLVVADHQGRVAILPQFTQTNFGLFQTLLSFEAKRQGHDTHGEYAHVPAGFGKHRCGSGSGSPSQTGCDEYHFGFAANEFLEFVHRFHGSLAANFRLVACPTPFRKVGTQLQPVANQVSVKGLIIRVADQEVHILDPFLKHMIHRVSTGAAYAYYFDEGCGIGSQAELKISEVCHLVMN